MKKENIQLRDKNRITIPSDLVEELHLEKGAQLEAHVEDGRLVLIPVITIARDQAWFWTESWQKGEREADEDIKAGRVSKSYDNADDLIRALQSDDWSEFEK
ncbi:AbrB/MazE/SpoVT family DNA-binding domain-containing protein [Virgibacillus natechei]|uniref:AbrB/MazE/SpoVT family DNA-binding domain-containing protein n=1 Tax=Virgibacillus sp. CBA3643 TaxID=2942278 RepID=UPI0035A30D1F